MKVSTALPDKIENKTLLMMKTIIDGLVQTDYIGEKTYRCSTRELANILNLNIYEVRRYLTLLSKYDIVEVFTSYAKCGTVKNVRCYKIINLEVLIDKMKERDLL